MVETKNTYKILVG